MVAPLAALSCPPAIVALTGHESNWQPLHRHELAGIRLRFLRHSQGWYRRRISSGIGRRTSMVSADNCDDKTASFSWPKSFCRSGPIGLASSTAMSRPPVPTWQVKSPAIVHRIQRLSRPSLPQSQPAHSTPQPGEKTPPPGSPKKHAKGRQYPQDSRGKRPGMKKPNSRDKSRQSTELIGAPIARDPIPNDGVYVFHLHDTQ